MLRVEDRFVIKDLYRAGVSISEIARRTGHDRKTIRHMVEAPLMEERRPRARRRQKIDPFVPYLKERIGLGVLNARKLHGEIAARGYVGGESQVRAFVHTFRPPPLPQATVRFETAPGEQAQVDWGHFGTIWHEGRMRRLYAFVMTLGWSRALYLEFTVATDLTWFLRGHQHAFAYFGGAPRQVVHDNLKTAVLGRGADGAVHWQPQYLDFAHYYGFAPHACRPYRAQTKGKVERSIGYVRGNFWPGLQAEDLPDLNGQARGWLDGTANARVHGTTGVAPCAPCARLPHEGLTTLAGKPPYDTSLVLPRQASRDCLVSYAGNLYSVPAAYARQRVLLKVTEDDEVVITGAQGEEVARHRATDGHGQRVVQPDHYHGLMPPALTPSGVSTVVTFRQGGALALDLATLLAAPLVEARPLAVYDELVGVSPTPRSEAGAGWHA